MASSRDDWCDLACDVVGVKLYDTQRITLPLLFLQREPTNLYDSNAVLVSAMYGGRMVTVGHMAKEAAQYVSPLLQASSYEVDRFSFFFYMCTLITTIFTTV